AWHPLTALLVGLATALILTIWTVVPSATFFGLPFGHTWQTMGDALQRAPSDFQSAVAPAALTTGFELVVVMGVGVVALFGDWLAFRVGSGLQGAAPAAVLFVACSVLGTISGRTFATLIEVAALLGFLLAHRSSVGQPPLPWFGNRRHGARNWATTVGLGMASVALLVGLLVVPALPNSEGHGVLGWRGGFGGGGGFRQVSNPIVDLHTRLIDEANTPVFTVTSPVSSYWRLTSLDTFTGQDWVSTDSYQGVHGRLPGVSNPPPGSRIVTERFHVQQLESVWLPVAFNPVQVRGGGRVSYDPVSGSLLTSHPTSDGLNYQVTSEQTLASLSPTQLRKAPPLPAGALSHDLQLPAGIPASVRQLARSIVAHRTTEYDKAIALVEFFQSAAFHYSLDPPDTGYGMKSLTNFLFVTRTGFCQQFAGSYAVLARLVGLPTRLAYGFATGTQVASNTYQVTDADAHTWPEVYFQGVGWVPFEPTNGSADPQSSSYTPSGDASTPAIAPKEPFAVPGIPSGNVTIPGALPRTGSAATSPGALPAASSGDGWLVVAIVAGVLLVAAVAWAFLGALARRVRWRRRRAKVARGELQPVEVTWAELAERLAWWGLPRQADETFVEFAARADRRLRLQTAHDGGPLPSLRPLAMAVSEAAYAPDVPAHTATGESAATEVWQLLWGQSSWRRRFAWWYNPHFTWQPVMVAARSSDASGTLLRPV
ncbi:MAG: hypothetical protein J2P57_17955, partial [Acidimicrobiaceae bacterium]|nr:hypothetical protein [Acidimicrobiaceae bacterium]